MKNDMKHSDFSHKHFRVKYKTRLNLVWGKKTPATQKKEALAYPEGFPATLYLTDRRAFVTGVFMEKRGLFRKKQVNTIYFEAGLQFVEKYKLDIYKKVKSGYILFKSHGDIKNGVIHFIRLTGEMIQAIKKVIDALPSLKKMRQDTGIVILGQNPIEILKKRLKE
jgi:hypothetical protein